MANEHKGVKYNKYPSQDGYSGTKEALIAAGVAQPEWFPEGIQRHKGGRLKHVFKFDVENGRASLRKDKAGEWHLDLPIPFVEFIRRHDELDAESEQRRATERRRDADTEYEQQVREADDLVRRLPSLDGELGAGEIDQVRVLRALSDKSWRIICRISKLTLLSDMKYGDLRQELRPLPPKLYLAVDNGVRR